MERRRKFPFSSTVAKHGLDRGDRVLVQHLSRDDVVLEVEIDDGRVVMDVTMAGSVHPRCLASCIYI